MAQPRACPRRHGRDRCRAARYRGAWAACLDVLISSATKTAGLWAAVPVPLWLRLPVVVVLVAWGPRTDRRWTVPVASMLALLVLWFGGASMLLRPWHSRPAAWAAVSGRARQTPAGSRPAWRPRFAPIRTT